MLVRQQQHDNYSPTHKLHITSAGGRYEIDHIRGLIPSRIFVVHIRGDGLIHCSSFPHALSLEYMRVYVYMLNLFSFVRDIKVGYRHYYRIGL